MSDRGRARFVFILGPERSGTTLLSAMLGGHSRIIAPPELHVLRFSSLAEWRREYPVAGPSLAFLLETLGLPPLEDEPAPLALYERILDAAPADAFIVDKSPAYSRVSDALRRAESFDPLYVWLVRHPLGVAASRIARRADLRKRSNDRLGSRLKYPAFLLRERLRRLRGAELRTLCEDWAGVHGRIREFLSEHEPGRWLRVSYERLVRAPREHADELCRFLGVAFESAMLDPRANVSAELRWGIGDESLLERERIEQAPADAWRQRYDAARVPASVARLAEQIGVEL